MKGMIKFGLIKMKFCLEFCLGGEKEKFFNFWEYSNGNVID